MPLCHYCGDEYDVTTDLERSYHDDDSEHNVCSGCLFDVLQGDEIEPLAEYADEVDK